MKNIESKTNQQLEAIEDQKEKQLEIISSNTLADGSKRIEFKNKENQKSIELINGVINMAKKIKLKNLYAFIQIEDHMILINLEA